ncbi:MAG: hypothetical protein J1D77_03440 [Muribaculaceae bacterium]|nr:hypothetical protein [Muribaculaceae bacterium]
MYIDPEILTLFLCLDLAILGFVITLDLALYAIKSADSNRSDPDRSPFLDADGDHSYYERSLIQKKSFLRKNPGVPLRTITRLFRNLLHLHE